MWLVRERPVQIEWMLLAFFLSGFAALSYETAWVRQLVSLFGVTYYAITTILTVFMAGLLLGAWAGGALIDRMRWRPLHVFIGLELFLALYAQLFPWLRELVEQLYLSVSISTELGFTGHTALRFLFGLAILIAPATASGATLPVATKAFVAEDGTIGRDISMLYGANVVGAALGAFVTTFFAIGLLGYPSTAWLGTAANAAAAIVAATQLSRTTRLPPRATAGTSRQRWHPEAGWIAAATFVMGFVALTTEILWTRAFSHFGINPSTFVFGMILGLWLLGHGAGAFVLYRPVRRRVPPKLLLSLLIAAVGAFSITAVLMMVPRLGTMAEIGWLKQLGLHLPLERFVLLVPAIILPSICTGMFFPLASELAIRERSAVGGGIGLLSALSTGGGILGSFLTGMWLMPSLGAVRCMVAAGSVCLMLAGVTWWALHGRRRGANARRSAAFVAGSALLGLVLMVTVPPRSHLILFPDEEVIAFVEGSNGATAVVDHPQAMRTMLVQGERLHGAGSSFTLATALNPEAERVLLIGVGTGTVAADALSESQIESITAVDTDGELVGLSHYILGEQAKLLQSDRFRFIQDDGRHFLATHDEQFDIIANDAAIYAWYLELSTLEFNRLVKSRLAPGGIYMGRLHLSRITPEALQRELATFLEVFPNSALYSLSPDIGLLVCRNGERPVDTLERLPRPGGVSTSFWLTAEQLAEIAEGGALITDDHPLHVPRTFVSKELEVSIEFTAPEDVPRPGSGIDVDLSYEDNELLIDPALIRPLRVVGNRGGGDQRPAPGP